LRIITFPGDIVEDKIVMAAGSNSANLTYRLCVESTKMRRSKSVCLLLVALSIYPVVASRLALAAQAACISETANHDPDPAGARRTTPNRPVITITRLCADPLNGKATGPNCKTVITQAQFEKIIAAIEPNMPGRGRKEFAERYADALVMARKAEQMGLDKGPVYEEQIKLAYIQILSQNLKKRIQERAAQVSESDVENYYRNNTARFEKAEVDRVVVPKTQHDLVSFDIKFSDKERLRRIQDSEQVMKDEVDSLYRRAAAGEDFTELQAEAYRVAGVKNAVPTTSLSIRRISLPPGQVSIMNLQAGELSSVMADPNGYVIYRIKAKGMLSLDQARDEIKNLLQSQRLQEEMRNIEDSATISFEQSYFAH
jgi:hypothetical protein